MYCNKISEAKTVSAAVVPNAESTSRLKACAQNALHPRRLLLAWIMRWRAEISRQRRSTAWKKSCENPASRPQQEYKRFLTNTSKLREWNLAIRQMILRFGRWNSSMIRPHGQCPKVIRVFSSFLKFLGKLLDSQEVGAKIDAQRLSTKNLMRIAQSFSNPSLYTN